MLKRKGSHGSGTWAVPGGHLEFGESFEEAARREILEETGLNIRNIRVGAVTNDYFENEQKHYATIWMISEYDSGEAAIMEPEKCDGLEWFDFDTLPSPLFLTWRQLLKSEFLSGIKKQLNG